MTARFASSGVTELHTAFGDGAAFVAAWQAWRLAAPQEPLHVVAISASQPVVSTTNNDPLAASLAHALRQAPENGLQHWEWEEGRVCLTLVVGPLLKALGELRLQADRVRVDDSAWGLAVDSRAIGQALARLAAPGAALRSVADDAPAGQAMCAALEAAGWVNDVAQGRGAYRFNPPWPVKTSREPWRAWARSPGTCAVVGAGIAGAAVAAALARRGWQVTVLDFAGKPAAGASGLPVGLAAPYATADDSPLARLTRHGVRRLMQQAQQRLESGVDWAPSGAQERLQGDAAGALQWQPNACWIKPAALVRAWLGTPGVTFRGSCSVHSLRRGSTRWDLLDARGGVLDTAERVVLANAAGVTSVVAQSPDLLAQGGGAGWPATHAVRGLVSWGHHARPETRPFPAAPVHGNGSLIAHVPFDDGARWFVGASYQPVSVREPEWPDDKNHGANALRLEKLAPELFSALTPMLEAGELKAWKGERCVTADRMPLLGPVVQTLPDVWTCAGFGSRGLSLVAVCAELLAAQWAADVWPVEASLAQALIPYRKHR